MQAHSLFQIKQNTPSSLESNIKEKGTSVVYYHPFEKLSNAVNNNNGHFGQLSTNYVHACRLNKKIFV